MTPVISWLFYEQANRLGPRVALRHKKDGMWRDLRWSELREQVNACALGLLNYGVRPWDRVGILSENRVEWLVVDLAILAIGAVNVPLHAPLSAEQVRYQIADAGVGFLFISTAAQLEKVQQIRGDFPDLRGIVFDSTTWMGLLQRGRAARGELENELQRRHAAIKPDNLATIIYTSGTTGLSKGVMLTHDNLHSNALAFLQVGSFGPESIFFNWLPFSHIYARTVDIYGWIASGATLCLAQSQETVVADLMDVQPTNMSGVPRLYEKVLTAVQDADPAVMKKRLHAIFGPRIDFLNSGGAPLPLAVARAYQDAGLLLLQGYGLTETSPVISFNRKDAYKLDSVGLPIPGIEVAIGPDGEVLTRGPHVMKGYWRNPQATAETVVDGWLHTGDLGRLDDDGFLYITGRKKELIVLSNGKKVVPSQIEGILLADPCIDQVVVCGEGRNFLSALVVPHWGNLCQQAGLQGEPAALSADPKVPAFLQARIQQALQGVAAWEQVKKIVILPEPFSVANDELTVSLKLRRSVIAEHHRAELQRLYGE